MFTKTDLDYYRLRKIPSLKGVIDRRKNDISIHKVINDKVCYDPYQIKIRGSSKHNIIQLFFSKYKRTKSQYNPLAWDEFLTWVYTNSQTRKYYYKFTKGNI